MLLITFMFAKRANHYGTREYSMTIESKDYRKVPEQVTQEMIDEVAAIGFRASVRLLSCKIKADETKTLRYIANKLERDITQVKWWTERGISHYLADRYLKLLHEEGIPFGIHQLLPTKRIAAMNVWRSNK